MDEGKLIGTMINVCKYFSKPEVRLDTIREWMKDLSQIPNDPMDWIERKIKANKYPDNPPKSIRSLFYQWLEENPDRIDREQAGCLECQNGWLWASKNGESRAFRCRRCNGLDNQPGIAVTRQDLHSYGWAMSWIHGNVSQIKSMPAHSMGKTVMGAGIQKWAEQNFKPIEEQDWRNQF
jgi:hypothetical protein